MPVKTHDVRAKLMGDARKALKNGAGGNDVISRAEQSRLPKDLAAAVETARRTSSRVSVDEAVDAYAGKVSRVLNAVDTRGRGTLALTEAKNIRDETLRNKVLDVRTALLAGDVGGTDPVGGGTTLPGSSSLVSALTGPVANLAGWWDSGDNGINVSISKVSGAASMAAALHKVSQDPATPWTHSESDLREVSQGAAAVSAFVSSARTDLEDWNPDDPAVVDAFVSAVTATFGPLPDVRRATGGSNGGSYLLGKTADGYVAVVVQPYRD